MISLIVTIYSLLLSLLSIIISSRLSILNRLIISGVSGAHADQVRDYIYFRKNLIINRNNGPKI